jgi:hypothetical protein
LRSGAGSGKNWPQGLHRSTEYPFISTGVTTFSTVHTPIPGAESHVRGPQTASNPSFCIYIRRRIRKVTATFRQPAGKACSVHQSRAQFTRTRRFVECQRTGACSLAPSLPCSPASLPTNPLTTNH